MMKSVDKTIGYFALVSDFGSDGPYLGQVHAVLTNQAPHIPVVDLLSNAPVFNPQATAYLLKSLTNKMPQCALFLCVVDPGVGGDRLGLIIETEKHLFVGPDNGLLSQVARDSDKCRVWSISCNLSHVPPTFHGRDVFAPIAARLANGECEIEGRSISPDSIIGWDWPEALYECIYVDHYGNIFTGIGEEYITQDMTLTINSTKIRFTRTFSDVGEGESFWYVNSCGLVEIAANMARASDLLGINIGDRVSAGRD